MEECYNNFAAKLKRKEFNNDDDYLSDFMFSSPATKMRRLDAELLPPIIEEEELVSPVEERAIVEEVVGGGGGGNVTIDEVPENEERAIVLYDPVVNNVPSRSPFSVCVNSDFLSGFKNPVIWSNRSHPIESLDGETENQNNNSQQNNGSLAVVPWVRRQSQHQAMPEVEVPSAEVSDMMDSDDMEATTMDIEDNNLQQIPRNGFGSMGVSESVNQWQQHCMIPQPPQNLSKPISWSGAFYS